MKLLACGDRNWTRYEQLCVVLNEIAIDLIAQDGKPLVVIEGGAPGADTCAWNWAMERGYEVIHCPAEWDRYGKSAGPRRNQVMLDKCPDLVVAFHADLEHSRGTGDMVRRALRAGVEVFHWDGVELVGLTAI